MRIRKSRKNTFLIYFLMMCFALIVVFLSDQSSIADYSLFYFAFYIATSLLIAWFFAGIFEERKISNIEGYMKLSKCWIKHYQNEKERIFQEHPELRNEEIRPYKLHYWDVFLYCCMLVIMVLSALIWATKSVEYSLILGWIGVLMIFMGGATLHSWKFKKCPEMVGSNESNG